ncbi:hypothetical protein [uncultured Aquimarina sp.]|uniref:hypothetical protein n=1 Tax=uncultured Aquimarina sp. TaxID=575652 RepID=UPI0026121AEF|nr:hypothetical protein [uncultured Aquimarina sp.]
MELEIENPKGEITKIRIIDRTEGNEILSRLKHEVLKEIQLAFEKKNIYRIENNFGLIDYTDNDFLILTYDFNEIEKIIATNEFDTINLHKIKSGYQYKFGLNQQYFLNPENLFNKVPKHRYERHLYHPNNEKMTYELAETSNGKFIFYFERAKGIYQGNWFPSSESLDYYYDNNYV